MLGQISGPEGDSLEQHVAECGSSATTLQALAAEDTLVEAMRAHRVAAAGAENDTVEELIKRLRQPPPASTVAVEVERADSLPATGGLNSSWFLAVSRFCERPDGITTQRNRLAQGFEQISEKLFLKGPPAREA